MSKTTLMPLTIMGLKYGAMIVLTITFDLCALILTLFVVTMS